MADSEGFSTAPESRRSEYLRLLAIAGGLIVLIALPAWLWTRHEKNRPTLVEARVVSATSTDPVFREGARSVAADETVELAVAIRLEYPGRGDRWLAPVENLILDGTVPDHLELEHWPEEDRLLRVFWFTLEPPFLGGDLNRDNAAAKLALRSFYAPELGRGLLAEGEPEAHADDGVNLGDEIVPAAAGTYRVYARVEVVDRAGTAHTLHVATTLVADPLTDPRSLRISRRLDPGLGLDPLAGELFRLPGFEVDGSNEPDIRDLADRRLATSSEVFAATAVQGRIGFEDGDLEVVSALQWERGKITTPSPERQWGSDIRTRDVLRQGTHWIVVVADDGDGVLGPDDVVAHAWRRPPALLPLESALDDEPATVDLLRPRRGPG